MLSGKNIFYYIITSLLFLGSCREAYISPVNPESQNLLVVEGFLNTGFEPTVINLSRTLRLVDSIPYKPEVGANVTVESENGSTWNLSATSPGRYEIFHLPLSPDQKYRLVIRTMGGEVYESDFIPVIITPPIDSISWVQNSEKDVEINISTHDPSNNTRYYRWDYEETWEIHSAWTSEYYFDNMTERMYERDNPQILYFCWKTLPSTEILMGSTAKQAEDIVRNLKLKTIKYGEQRLAVRYSIMLKQYGLTKDAFDYWQTMKKNTEGMGSIFDPQPSVNFSNIRNVNNPEKPVIGFLSAGSYTSKRIFIRRNEIDWLYRRFCEDIVVPNIKDSLVLFFGTGSLIPTYGHFNEFGAIVGYSGSTAPCVDCRLTGSPFRPPFW